MSSYIPPPPRKQLCTRSCSNKHTHTHTGGTCHGPGQLPPSHMHAGDGWFLQPKRRPARLPRRTVPSNCICRCSRMRARLPPPRVLLPHTCTQDGWFLQPKRRPARLPRRTVPSNCICRCSSVRARLPLHILLLHTGGGRKPKNGLLDITDDIRPMLHKIQIFVLEKRKWSFSLQDV
jgi:hypothetical protein